MYSYVSTKSTYTYTYNTQIPMLDIKFCLLVHDRIYKNVFGLCPGIFFIHICIYMYASECDQTRAQIVFMSLFSTFSKFKMKPFHFSTFLPFRLFEIQNEAFPLCDFSTFRNSVWNLSTFRLFDFSKLILHTFWLEPCSSFLPSFPHPAPPTEHGLKEARTWVSLVSRHTEPEVSPSQKYFGNTLWWFNIAMENHHF